MKILHVSQPTDGGTAVVVRELTRMALERGHDVTVACPDEGFLAEWVRQSGAGWRCLPMRRQPGISDFKAVGRIRGLAAGADVLHLHSSKAGAVGRLAAFSLGRRRPRTIFTAHGWSWYVGGRSAPLYRGIERMLAPVTDAIVAVSDQELVDGREVLGPRARLHLVPNGVSLDAFSPTGPVADRSEAPLMVLVGRLSRQKGQDRAIELLSLMSRHDVVLRLVGEGPDHDELNRSAERLGVGSRVEFVGPADPRPHLRAADVVLLPSRWEGMPLALLEAMAMAKAILITDVGGSEALSGAGVVVSGRDEDEILAELAREAQSLLESPDRRLELESRARRRCEERYDLDLTLETYQRLWTQGR